MKTYTCLDCENEFTSDGYLNNKLCENCGTEWWDYHYDEKPCNCNICEKLVANA